MNQFWSSAMSSFSKDINDWFLTERFWMVHGIFSFVNIAGKIRRSRAFCIAYYINKASPQLKGFSITNWSACSVVVKGINRQHSCRNVLIPRLAISCFALKSERFEPRKNWKKKACGDSDTLGNWSSRKKQRERPPPNLTKNIFLPATANHSFDFLSIFWVFGSTWIRRGVNKMCTNSASL